MRGLGIRLPAASEGRGRDRRHRAPVPIFSFSTKNPRGLSMLCYGLSVDRTLPPSPRFSLITRFSSSPATTRRIIRALPNAPRSLTSGFSSPPATTRCLIRAPDSATAAFPPRVSIALIPDRRSWGILASRIFRLTRVCLLFSWNRGRADLLTRDPETGSASLIFAGVRLSPADRTGRLVAPLPSGLGLTFLVALGPGVQRFGSVGRIGAVFRCRPSGRLARRARPRRVGSFLLTPGPSAPPGIRLPICVYVGRPAGPGPTVSLSFTPLALSSW